MENSIEVLRRYVPKNERIFATCRCDYCVAVNKFIPEASEIADSKTKRWSNEQERKDRREVNAHWDKVFHQEMNRLTKEAGLRYL